MFIFTMDTGVVRETWSTAPTGGLMNMVKAVSFFRSGLREALIPVTFTSYISPGFTSLSVSALPSAVTVTSAVARVSDWPESM